MSVAAALAACGSHGANMSAAAPASPPPGPAPQGNAAVNLAMRACIAELAARDPAADARRDAAAGERRLFPTQTDPATFPDATGLRGCTLPLAGMAPRRPGFFDRYDYEDDRGRADLRAECGLAIGNYKGAYNRALASVAPDSIRRSCTEGRGRIDPGYRPADLDEFRRRMLGIYGE